MLQKFKISLICLHRTDNANSFFKKICANPASFCLFHPFYQYNDKYSSRFAYIKAWMVSLEFEPGAAVWYAMVAPICNANSCFKSDSLITDCEAVHSENIHRRRKDHCADFQFYQIGFDRRRKMSLFLRSEAVESNIVKRETSHTVMLHPTASFL